MSISDKGKLGSEKRFRSELTISVHGRMWAADLVDGAQGYCPDFLYEDDLGATFMIWPIFVDGHNEPLL